MNRFFYRTLLIRDIGALLRYLKYHHRGIAIILFLFDRQEAQQVHKTDVKGRDHI